MENYTFEEALDSLCLESIESAVNNADIDTLSDAFEMRRTSQLQNGGFLTNY